MYDEHVKYPDRIAVEGEAAKAEYERLKERIAKLEAALRQCKENAASDMIPSSVVHAIADEALKEEARK